LPDFTLLSKSLKETQQIGALYAKTLSEGHVIGLVGQLGTGKTAFVQGMAEGLGFRGSVTSPTFAIAHEYPSKPRLYHLDCFRLRTHYEVRSSGVEEILAANGIVVIEWADMLESYFQNWHSRISFDFDERHFEMRKLQFSLSTTITSNRLLQTLHPFQENTQ
jgi:tRNA threonylcarbamoyladenosine biosynthesis protein TsaE